MNAQVTYLRTQQHVADLQREADQGRRTASSNAKPAEPRRASVRRRWRFLWLVTDRRDA